ncbi:hypothetical protein GCM10020295_21790 [Streptomyces cinereospinus]
MVQRVVPDGESLALAAEQDLLVREQPAQAHGVHRHAVDAGAARPSRAVTVASGAGAEPALARAAAMSWAVRVAVPLGASTLLGWCSSTTSTDSK